MAIICLVTEIVNVCNVQCINISYNEYKLIHNKLLCFLSFFDSLKNYSRIKDTVLIFVIFKEVIYNNFKQENNSWSQFLIHRISILSMVFNLGDMSKKGLTIFKLSTLLHLEKKLLR